MGGIWVWSPLFLMDLQQWTVGKKTLTPPHPAFHPPQRRLECQSRHRSMAGAQLVCHCSTGKEIECLDLHMSIALRPFYNTYGVGLVLRASSTRTNSPPLSCHPSLRSIFIPWDSTPKTSLPPKLYQSRLSQFLDTPPHYDSIAIIPYILKLESPGSSQPYLGVWWRGKWALWNFFSLFLLLEIDFFLYNIFWL